MRVTGCRLQQGGQLVGMVEHPVGAPRVRIAAIEVTPAHGHGVQARRPHRPGCRGDRRRRTRMRAGSMPARSQASSTGAGSGFFTGRVSPETTAPARAGPADARKQRVGEKAGLVGDDAPAHARGLDPCEQGVDAVERHASARAITLLVQRQIARHQRLDGGLATRGEGAAQDRPRAARNHLAHRRIGRRRNALLRALRAPARRTGPARCRARCRRDRTARPRSLAGKSAASCRLARATARSSPR